MVSRFKGSDKLENRTCVIIPISLGTHQRKTNHEAKDKLPILFIIRILGAVTPEK